MAVRLYLRHHSGLPVNPTPHLYDSAFSSVCLLDTERGLGALVVITEQNPKHRQENSLLSNTNILYLIDLKKTPTLIISCCFEQNIFIVLDPITFYTYPTRTLSIQNKDKKAQELAMLPCFVFPLSISILLTSCFLLPVSSLSFVHAPLARRSLNDCPVLCLNDFLFQGIVRRHLISLFGLSRHASVIHTGLSETLMQCFLLCQAFCLPYSQ